MLKTLPMLPAAELLLPWSTPAHLLMLPLDAAATAAVAEQLLLQELEACKAAGMDVSMVSARLHVGSGGNEYFGALFATGSVYWLAGM